MKKTAETLGRLVQAKMDANGQDRKKAIRAVLDELTADPETAVDWWEGAGAYLLGEAHRHAVRTRKQKTPPQPDQLRRNHNGTCDWLEQGFPTGPTGEWKKAKNLTRGEVQAQIEMWSATVRGLQRRIAAGEEIVGAMREDETLGAFVGRSDDRLRTAVRVYLGESGAVPAAT